MADDVEIKIDDRIAATIASKLREIRGEATSADTAIERLKANLNIGNSASLLKAANDTAKFERALKQASTITYSMVGRTSSLADRMRVLAAEEARAAANSERLAQSLRRQQVNATNAGNAIRTLGGYFGAYIGVKTFTDAADAAQTLENKLRAITTSSAQYAAVSERIYKMAIDNRVSVESLGTAYQRFRNAMDGVSDSKILRFIDTLSKGLVTFGATTGEAASTITQLSQAFNKGKLDGDEFRSVSENFPPLMNALTAAFGKTKEEIYALSKAGKLTGQTLVDAFAQIAPKIDAQFAKTVATIGQALEVLSTKFKMFVGDNSEAARLLVQAIGWIGDNLNIVVPAVLAFAAAWAAVGLVTLIGQVWGLVTGIAAIMAPVLAAITPIYLWAIALFEVGYAIAKIRGEEDAYINAVSDTIVGIIKQTAETAKLAVATISAAAGIDTLKQSTAELKANLDETGTAAKSATDGIKTIAGGKTSAEIASSALEKTTKTAKNLKEEATLAAGELRTISGNASGVYDVQAALSGATASANGLATAVKSISGNYNGIIRIKQAVDQTKIAMDKAGISAQRYEQAMQRAAAKFRATQQSNGTYTNSPSFQNITGNMSGSKGYATGGSFMVGGRAGRDTNPVGFMATKGEKVTIQTKAQQREAERDSRSGRAGDTYIELKVYANDADSFRRSRKQVADELARIIQ